MEHRGFTIVELIITITIMGILLTLAVVGLSSTQLSARDNERTTDVEALALQLEAYYQAGTPPANLVEVTNGLVGWWKFNGNANDSAGSANGTVYGASLTQGQNSQSDSAYAFDGIDDYIEVDPVLNSGNALTISAWARGLAGPSAASGIAYIIHRGVDTTQGTSLFWLGANSVDEYDGDVSGYSSADTGVSGGPSAWHLVTMTYDGTTRIVYVDGVSTMSEPRAMTNSLSGTRVGIGGTAFNGSYRPFQGDIDDVRIYNRPLSQQEVEILYQTGGSNTSDPNRYPPVWITAAGSITEYLIGLDEKTAIAPGEDDPTATFIAATNNTQTPEGVTPQPTTSQYVYQPIDQNGDLCITSLDCRKFNLYYRLEADNTVYKVTSKHQ